jgi:hypothetical protein
MVTIKNTITKVRSRPVGSGRRRKNAPSEKKTTAIAPAMIVLAEMAEILPRKKRPAQEKEPRVPLWPRGSRSLGISQNHAQVCLRNLLA